MDILKCPFCGSPASVLSENTNYSKHTYYKVYCDNERCTTNKIYIKQDEAIEEWNRRVNEDRTTRD